MPSAILITVIALWVYYCMSLLLKASDACTLPLIPTNEDPYKTVARKVGEGAPSDL